MAKENRHRAIREIITTNQVESQEILLNLLAKKDIDVTQATLSRDIKELQIIKAPTENGSYMYKLNNNNTISSNSSSNFGNISLEFSGNLAVLKTRPGYAMAVAGEIDGKISREILGTVAGDDTILLIIKENISRGEVIKALSHFRDIIIK